MGKKWDDYMESKEWRAKCLAVRKRCHGICERCGVTQMDVTHHLTYARRYRELLEDLQGLCVACHAYIHGRLDEDPAYDAQFVPTPEPLRVSCETCGVDGDLVGRTGDKFYCEDCSMAMDSVRRTDGAERLAG